MVLKLLILLHIIFNIFFIFFKKVVYFCLKLWYTNNIIKICRINDFQQLKRAWTGGKLMRLRRFTARLACGIFYIAILILAMYIATRPIPQVYYSVSQERCVKIIDAQGNECNCTSLANLNKYEVTYVK